MPQEATGSRRPGYESARFIAPVSPSAVPITEISQLGPIAISATHAAFVPWAPVSGAPGVGVANLAYIPGFLMSAPNYYGGNATVRRANAIQIATHATMVTGQPSFLEGVGGLTSGQIITAPLLGMQQQNDNDSLGYFNRG